MKRPDGATRTMSLALIVRDDQRRTAVALHHPCGRDANDAPVPALAINHDAVGIAQQWLLREALLDGQQNPALGFLSLGIELVEPEGDLAGAPGIFHAEEFDHV